MRALLRTEVDVTKTPDLSELSSLEAVTVAVRAKYYESDMNQKRLRKEATKALSERMKSIEDLKRVILSRVSRKLRDEQSNYDFITLLLDRSCESFIEDTLNSADFSAFSIKIIQEDPDYLVSFPDLPIKIKVTRRF